MKPVHCKRAIRPPKALPCKRMNFFLSGQTLVVPAWKKAALGGQTGSRIRPRRRAWG